MSDNRSRHDRLAVRLSLIISRLMAGESLSLKTLSDEFGVTERTLQRDFHQRLVHLDLEYRNGRYSLRRQSSPGAIPEMLSFIQNTGIARILPLRNGRLITCLTDNQEPSPCLIWLPAPDITATFPECFSQLILAIRQCIHISLMTERWYGTLLEDNNLSYSVQTGYAGGGDGNSGSTGYATLNYRGGYGNANIGYSHSDDIKQLYYGVSGGVLAHANGVTLGQPLNDTVVLVKAPGAKDAKVENQTGVRTDWRGYAVLPYATEYRENRVALDTNTLADNVDLDNAVANVVPTRGAIVRAEFKARVGIKLLMTLTHNNKPLPFGAMVTSESSQSSGIVADNGQVYLSGMPLAGKVQVKWGEEENAHCIANYQLPPESQQQLLTQLSAECR